MKYLSTSLLLLLGSISVSAFRNETEKKDYALLRRLEEEMECTINHDLAQSSQEIRVWVQTFPGDGQGLFDITVYDEPWAPKNGHVTHHGWCIDYDRFIDKGWYTMDIFSAFDPDLHYHDNDARKRAVDKRENLPNLAWLINHWTVGQWFNKYVDGQRCSGRINWKEMQGAVWMIIDDKSGYGTWYGQRQDCISRGLAKLALQKGNNYVPNCLDTNEEIPIVYVVDNAYGNIQNQVIMSETKLASIEGMCQCHAKPKTCDDIPDFNIDLKGLPAYRFEDNPNCQDLGYSFGYKMEGCTSVSNKEFDSLVGTKGSCMGGEEDVGKFDLQCLYDGGEKKDAVITPTVDSVVIMKGGNGGVVYDGLKAGQTYTLDVGARKGISHIEFCFRCDGPCPSRTVATPEPTAAPTDNPTAKPTDAPTDGPTPSPTDGPTASPTKAPTDGPTPSPTDTPTAGPTKAPTDAPTVEETDPPAPDSPTPGDRTFDSPVSYVKGDPHFKTFGGEYYDFHGECDMVLLHNPLFKDGLGMDIHIRTKIEDFWSSVESAALAIGDNVIEIHANANSKEWLWINGNLVEADPKGKWGKDHLGDFLVRYREASPGVREANIYIEGPKERIQLKTFKSFVRIDVDTEGSVNYYGAMGLLGSWDNNGLRLGRDGKTLIKNHHKFGMEWQVLESEPKLFHSYEGAVVGRKCVMPPTYTREAAAQLQLRKRRLAESGMTEEDAEKACSHLHDPEERKSCVYDVIATQDLSMASVW